MTTIRNRKPSATPPDSSSESVAFDPQINERLAGEVEKEIWFRISRLPGKITRAVEMVPLFLLCLWLILVYTNNYGALGYWEAFVRRSNHFRDRFTHTSFAQTLGLDSPALNPYSLWRGVVVISVSSIFTYLCLALLFLRLELFHWKPSLLESYLMEAKSSFLGRYLPESWLYYIFNLYQSEHAKRTRNRIQNRDHRATEDHIELAKVVNVVLQNLLISPFVVFLMWMALCQTGFDSVNILQSPRSMVPPVQIAVWLLIGDTLHFFPHYIAHTPRGSKGIHHKVIPHSLASRLENFLRNAHKTHHRSKANIAIAAWYCSPTEQIFFNLFPVMLGPVVTQIIADKTGNAEVWGTHIVTLYVWLLAGTASSVLAHTGYRSSWNDPGEHDEHHEYAFGQRSVNFGLTGFWDSILGTSGTKAAEGAKKWQEQRRRHAALAIASKRTGIPLTKEQQIIAEQPMVDYEWVDKRVED